MELAEAPAPALLQQAAWSEVAAKQGRFKAETRDGFAWWQLRCLIAKYVSFPLIAVARRPANLASSSGLEAAGSE